MEPFCGEPPPLSRRAPSSPENKGPARFLPWLRLRSPAPPPLFDNISEKQRARPRTTVCSRSCAAPPPSCNRRQASRSP